MLSPGDLARLAAFKKSKVGHRNLVRADEEVRAFVHAPADSAALLVMGPTGVGKSTLLDRAIEKLTAELRPELEADPQRLPPVAFDCPPPIAGTFSWTDWLREGLRALQDLSPLEHIIVPADPRLPVEPGRRASIGELRDAFLAEIGARRPPAIANDEGQQLTGVGRGQRLLTQLDFIKSLADASQVPFVLVGTYDLQALRNVSGQLGRRCQEVHFARYKISDVDDWAEFRNVLNTFATELPIDPEILLKNAERVYAGCCGCVGTLKQWLMRAFTVALEAHRDIAWADLEAKALPLLSLQQIAAEIATGEEAMLETAEQLKDLHELLGMTQPKRKRRAPRRRGRVGRRAPGHDKVERAA